MKLLLFTRMALPFISDRKGHTKRLPLRQDRKAHAVRLAKFPACHILQAKIAQHPYWPFIFFSNQWTLDSELRIINQQTLLNASPCFLSGKCWQISGQDRVCRTVHCRIKPPFWLFGRKIGNAVSLAQRQPVFCGKCRNVSGLCLTLACFCI